MEPKIYMSEVLIRSGWMLSINSKQENREILFTLHILGNKVSSKIKIMKWYLYGQMQSRMTKNHFGFDLSIVVTIIL